MYEIEESLLTTSQSASVLISALPSTCVGKSSLQEKSKSSNMKIYFFILSQKIVN